MIKFTSEHGGRTLIGLGLSAGNIERLKQGKPIHFHLEEMNLPYMAEVMIMYGETEQAMVDTLKEFITEETVVHRERQKQ